MNPIALFLLCFSSLAHAEEDSDDDPDRTTTKVTVIVDDPAPASSRRAKSSAGQNLFGGRLVTVPVVVLSSGFPHGLQVEFRLPLGQVELAPRFYFDHSQHNHLGFDPGTGVGFDARIHVFGSDGWDVAIHTALAFDARFLDPFEGTLDLFDPGVRVSKDIDGVLDIDFGMSIIPQLSFGDRGHREPSFSVAVPFRFGIEGDIAPGVQIGFTGAGGPQVRVHPGGNFDVGPWAEALLHFGFSLGPSRRR